MSDTSHAARIVRRNLLLKGAVLAVVCVCAAIAGTALGIEPVCQAVSPMVYRGAKDLCSASASADLWRVTSYAFVVTAVRLTLLPLLVWRFVASAAAMYAVIAAAQSRPLRLSFPGWVFGSLVVCFVCALSLYTNITGPRDAQALQGHQYGQKMLSPVLQAALLLFFLPILAGIVMKKYWGKSVG